MLPAFERISEMKSYIRPSSEIERQIAEFRSALPEGVTSPPAGDFAAQLQWDAWQHHLKELHAELDEAIDAELAQADIVFALDGDPVSGHAIQAGFLGTFLDKSQKLINAIAQVFDNRPTGRGVIPNHIIADHRLMVEGVYRSSFGLKLRLLTDEELGRFRFDKAETVLDQFCKLIDPDLAQTELLGLIAHPRVKTHYLSLVKTVANGGASLRVRTSRMRAGVYINAAQARDREVWLTNFSAERSISQYVGILTGGSVASNKFELQVEDDTYYKGTISSEARDKMMDIHFGERVGATIEETTFTAEEGQTECTVTYHLLKIESVDSP